MWQLRLTQGQDGRWADHAAQSPVISANELVSFLQGGVGAVMSFLRTTGKAMNPLGLITYFLLLLKV